jgi:hypothetical protein
VIHILVYKPYLKNLNILIVDRLIYIDYYSLKSFAFLDHSYQYTLILFLYSFMSSSSEILYILNHLIYNLLMIFLIAVIFSDIHLLYRFGYFINFVFRSSIVARLFEI